MKQSHEGELQIGMSIHGFHQRGRISRNVPRIETVNDDKGYLYLSMLDIGYERV